jgi:hypothetical protein
MIAPGWPRHAGRCDASAGGFGLPVAALPVHIAQDALCRFRSFCKAALWLAHFLLSRARVPVTGSSVQIISGSFAPGGGAVIAGPEA